MGCKALTAHTLAPAALAADRAAAQKIENSGVGEKALYLPGRLMARGRYVPLAAIGRAYLRLMVGERRHGSFRQPLLVLQVDEKEIVFLYGKEQTVRSLLDALAKRGVAVGKPHAPKPN